MKTKAKPLMLCPKCGGTDLRVFATVLATVDGMDMSADTTSSDVEWGRDSYAACATFNEDTNEECDWDGIVEDALYPDEEEED